MRSASPARGARRPCGETLHERPRGPLSGRRHPAVHLRGPAEEQRAYAHAVERARVGQQRRRQRRCLALRPVCAEIHRGRFVDDEVEGQVAVVTVRLDVRPAETRGRVPVHPQRIVGRLVFAQRLEVHAPALERRPEVARTQGLREGWRREHEPPYPRPENRFVHQGTGTADSMPLTMASGPTLSASAS